MSIRGRIVWLREGLRKGDARKGLRRARGLAWVGPISPVKPR